MLCEMGWSWSEEIPAGFSSSVFSVQKKPRLLSLPRTKQQAHLSHGLSKRDGERKRWRRGGLKMQQSSDHRAPQSTAEHRRAQSMT